MWPDNCERRWFCCLDQGTSSDKFCRGQHIALDIAAGLAYLHRLRILHLDVKSPNVLLDKHGRAYVADIGLGKMIAGSETIASAATFFWAAPEQLQVSLCPLRSLSSYAFAGGMIMQQSLT